MSLQYSFNCDIAKNNISLLELENKAFPYFPMNISDCYPNISSILLKNVELKELKRDHLKNLQMLKILDLSSNKVEYLEPNLFDSNPEMEEIDLSKNKLSKIDSQVFQKLTKLKKLNLFGNVCIGKNYRLPSDNWIQLIENINNDLSESCSGKKNIKEVLDQAKQDRDRYDLKVKELEDSNNETKQKEVMSNSTIENLKTELEEMNSKTQNRNDPNQAGLTYWIILGICIFIIADLIIAIIYLLKFKHNQQTGEINLELQNYKLQTILDAVLL